MRQRIFQILTVFLFVGILFASLITFDYSGSTISAEENRKLADFPTFDNLNMRWENRDLMLDTESWLNDHIGLRQNYRALYTNAIEQPMNISSSDQVVHGLNDWLFMTGNNNIQIAKGTYPLSEQQLDNLAAHQMAVHEYYKKNGIEYFLCLTPSKASIYYEFLPFAHVNVSNTPVDMAYNRLKDTGIQVVELKSALLENKSDAQLFYKTDSHWNTKGTYVAYQSLIKSLKPQDAPVEVDFSVWYRTGDLNKLLGLTKQSDKEEAYGIVLENNAVKVPVEEMDPDFIAAVQESFKRHNATYYEPLVYTNENVEEGTLLVYGDSMMSDSYGFPTYLAQHYHKIVVLRLRWVDPVVEDFIQPDQVIFSSTERLINPLLINSILDIQQQ